MNEHRLTTARIVAFREYLIDQERESSTVEKYLHDIREFHSWLNGRTVTKETASLWKEHLAKKGYAPATINGKIAALSSFLEKAGWQECKIRPLRIQHKAFRDSDRELTKEEYEKLVTTANDRGRERLALILETICATGIRVSELRYITVEALDRGRAEIAMKGKIRTIMIPGKLRRKLMRYVKKKKIVSGEVFLTRNGKAVSRKQIWAEMKALCKKAGIEAGKVFPHNLRHLFARCFYQVCRDIARLADVLGHSSIDTTRIYLISSGVEHERTLERLRLIT